MRFVVVVVRSFIYRFDVLVLLCSGPGFGVAVCGEEGGGVGKREVDEGGSSSSSSGAGSMSAEFSVDVKCGLCFCWCGGSPPPRPYEVSVQYDDDDDDVVFVGADVDDGCGWLAGAAGLLYTRESRAPRCVLFCDCVPL